LAGEAPNEELLKHRWTLYYEKKSRNNKAGKGLTKTDYLKELQRVGTFQTIRDFWSTWNQLLEACNTREAANYHFFKDDIKPVWEDAKNVKGGKWVINLPTGASEEETIKLWMSLILALLTGEWGVESEINGVVLQARPWGNMFSIWNRNANDKQLIDTVGIKLQELFKVDHVKYQRHQATIRKNQVDTKPKSQLRGSQSDDSNSGDNSDEDMRRRRKSTSFLQSAEPIYNLDASSNGIYVPRSEVKETEVNLPPPPTTTIEEKKPFVRPINETNPKIERRFSDEDYDLRKSRRKAREPRHSNSFNEHSSQQTNTIGNNNNRKKAPLPEVKISTVGLALAAGVAASALSWAAYYL
jgi:translation initiation factor 4E